MKREGLYVTRFGLHVMRFRLYATRYRPFVTGYECEFITIHTDANDMGPPGAGAWRHVGDGRRRLQRGQP